MKFFEFILTLSIPWCVNSGDIKFVCVVTTYNNAAWYEQNLNSIFSQHYPHYRVVCIDDCSTDGTADLIKSYIENRKPIRKFELICNKQRNFKMANLYSVISSFSDNREVVVEIDGDDFLAHPWVLGVLAEVYSKGDIWFTYGQFVHLSNGDVCAWNKDIPKDVVQKHQFRQYPNLPSHLRSFYVGLFKKIKKRDLIHKGKFVSMSSDVAIALPMIEMAARHFKFISEPLLVYNDLNDINDHKVDSKHQFRINTLIRKRPKYHAVDSLF